MSRVTTKTRVMSKKRAVKKFKKAQLPVRIRKQTRPTALRHKAGVETESIPANVTPSVKTTEVKKAMEGRHIDPKKIERDKRLMMWAGVVFFMVLICSVWIFNLKNVFRINQIKNTNSSAVEEWDKIADEFGKSWAKVKQGMNELNNEATESDKDIFNGIATTTDGAVLSEGDEIEELKKRLEELESKIYINIH
ncbi:MAG: hypothetical protein U9R14_04750 [Patescibacteria group bacterium]|nr:hypothetical protein [Patescibacteria group bacterium]